MRAVKTATEPGRLPAPAESLQRTPNQCPQQGVWTSDRSRTASVRIRERSTSQLGGAADVLGFDVVQRCLHSRQLGRVLGPLDRHHRRGDPFGDVRDVPGRRRSGANGLSCSAGPARRRRGPAPRSARFPGHARRTRPIRSLRGPPRDLRCGRRRDHQDPDRRRSRRPPWNRCKPKTRAKGFWLSATSARRAASCRGCNVPRTGNGCCR